MDVHRLASPQYLGGLRVRRRAGPVCGRMREVSKMSFSREERRPGWLSELLQRA